MHRGASAFLLPLAALLVVAQVGCGGAGRYGYARTYVPLDDERAFSERAEETVYDEVRRAPESYQNQTLSWFGVVTGVELSGGTARVAMQLRAHQERHLCEDESESTCRVTVSARDGGPFTALVALRPDDAAGENRVQPNSLLRVYGRLVAGEYDAQGGPVLRAAYYRHWPRGEYVTTAASANFRR